MLTFSFRRRRLLLAASAWCAAAQAAPADVPGGTLRIVSPFPAGGSVDFWSRALAVELEARHGFEVQALNIPGSTGAVALDQIHRTPDVGHTTLLLAGTAQFSQMPLLPDSILKFDPNDAFVPVAILWEELFFLAVHRDSALRTLDDFIAQGRNAARRLSMGSTGPQSTGGIYLEHFMRRWGLDVTHVPFKGMTEVVTGLVGRHLDLGILSYQQARPQVESGTLRLIACSGSRRSPLEPQVPTFVETGKLDFGATVWFGLFVRKGTAPQALDAISAALAAVLREPPFRARMAAAGYGVLGLTGPAALEHLRASNRTWRRMLGRNPPP